VKPIIRAEIEGSGYPQCSKLSDHDAERTAIMQFLEWLEEEKIVLARWNREIDDLDYLGRSKDALVMEYFGVDVDELERERRAILQKLREDNLASRKVVRGWE
jgi:molybdopterin converting factor small subunit